MVATRLTSWLSQFCSWHAQFKSGSLGADELPAYLQARSDLGAILVLANASRSAPMTALARPFG